MLNVEMPFIGGNITELEYNFFNKIEGSMKECPMKCSLGWSATKLPPISSDFSEYSQTQYNRLKALDEDILSPTANDYKPGDKLPQMLIEVDLSGLCNKLFGGSINVLKSNIQNTTVECFGPNNQYGWSMYVWNSETSTWRLWDGGEREKLVCTLADVYPYGSNNKLYILIALNNPNVVEPTQIKLSLNYINIKIRLKRQPELIKPISLDLDKEWSILMRGISYAWANTPLDKYIFSLKNKSVNKSIDFKYTKESKGKLDIKINNQPITTPDMPSIRTQRFESNNYLLQYKDKTLTLYHLDKQSLRKESVKLETELGSELYFLTLREMDAFIEDIQVFSQVFNEQESEILMRGRNTIDVKNTYYNKLAEMTQSPNLIPDFNSTKWVLNKNATIDNGGNTLTLVATTLWEQSSIKIPVLPNNKYEFKCKKTATGRIDIDFIYSKDEPSTLDDVITFITPERCNNIYLALTNGETGTFTFSNLELRRLD